jgi:lysozyme family protein
MSFPNEARGRLTEARNVLIDRRRQTNDAKERAAIDDAITVLNENLGFINQAALLDAAAAVVDATNALEAVVRSARLGPFDLHVKALEGVLEKIGDLLRNGEVGEHLERAPEPVVTPTIPAPSGSSPVSGPAGSAPAPTAGGPTTASPGGVSAPTAASPAGGSAGSGNAPISTRPFTVPPGNVSAPPTTGPTTTTVSPGSASTPASAGSATVPPGSVPTPTAPKPPGTPQTVTGGVELPPIGTSSNFTALRSELDAWFKAVILRDDCKDKVEWHTKQLLKHQSRYRDVGFSLNRMPWAMIGVIHAMECGFNFACHLHNGDPLTNRTKHVPAGQPQMGTPPFSWENSAVDALTQEGFNTVTDWSVPHMLYLLEKFNGFGYRKMGKPSPYLWSFSNLYAKGKYVADGRFDPQSASKQCGAAIMVKALIDRGTDLSS